MTGTRTKPAFERQLVGLAVAACFAGIVHANPTGPAVAHGSASFATSGKTLTVTNTPGAIINWAAFSIRPDEVTRFIQTGAASAVLNRVTGPGQSAILGQLLSNGRVFLINPNGVVVGAGARIDTAGFVASSLNLSNEDFLAGRFRFTDPGNAGKVTNAGSIHSHSGGPVYLIAPTVENHGVITAPNGDITLAAGKSVELVAAGNPHLRVQVEAGGEAVNVGQLLADSGRVGLYGTAIRNAGTISADSASVNAAGNVVLKASRDVTLERTSVVSASGAKGGTVEIQAEQGTLLAEGRIAATGAAEQGGEVKLLGVQVGLVGNAAVDASGAKGGGTVLVGGDYQGKNTEIQNAARVVLAPDAKIAADATERGDGGRVIVWSDEYTGFYGTISARGGAAGGNGGFVETSSKDNLQALGSVDAAAPLGRAGEWLLDPSNVTISAAATANGGYSGGSPNIFSTAANNAVANVGTLQASLNAGTSVTINTTPGGAQAGTITLAAATPITKSAGGGAALTLNAQSNIVLNSGITSTSNTLDVNLNAGLGGAGTITLNNASLNGGTLTANAPGAITQTAGTTIQGTTSLVKQGAGAMTLSQANTYTGTTNVQAGTLTVTNATGLGTVAGGTSVAAGATLAINGTITVADALTLSGTGVGAAGALQRTGGTPTASGAVTLASDASIGGAAGTLNVSGALGGPGNLTKVGAGTVNLSGNSAAYNGTITVNAGTLTASAANALGSAVGATTVNAGATLALIGTFTSAEAVNLNGATLSRTAGNPTLNGNVALTGNNTITGAAGTTTLGGVVSGAGNLSKTGAGTLVLGGNNTYTGTTTVAAGTLQAASANALGATGAASGTSVTAGATLNVDNVSIGEALTLNGTGVGAAGALTGTGAGVAVTGPVTLASNASVGAAAAASVLTISGAVGQSGGVRTLTKVGAGTVNLTGANTYTGATTVSAGTLVASNATALGTAAAGTTVANGATLRINNVAIGAEAVTINGTGVGAAGALQGAGTASLAGSVALATASTVGVTVAADALTLSGIVSGGNALTKAGAGTLTLSGANIYTGATTINAGTVVASNATALGTVAGGTTVAAGATLNINNVAIGAEAVTLNGTLQGTGAGAALAGGVALGAASALNAAAAGDTLTLTGVVSGANALSKNGAGAVVLAGAAANTYGGATNVNAGTLRVGAATNKIPDASAVTVAAGATLDLNGFSETVGSLAGAGGVTLGAGTLTAGGNNGTTTFSGVIGGAGGLTKAGTGALTLSGANTYAGATTINAGTVVASNASALGTTAGGTTVAAGATLNINNVTVGAEAATINGNGVAGAGALTGAGVASLGGPVTVASASRIGATAGNALTLNGAVDGANALDVAGGGTITFGSAVGNVTPLASIASAAGTALNVNGGLVRTSGTQTYNGAVTTGGPATLQTTNSAIAASGAMTATAGTLTLNTGTGAVTMTNAANDFATVTIPSGGTVSLVDQNALALGASSVGMLQARTLSGKLTLGGVVTASGAGNSIVLAPAGSLVNGAGPAALVVPVGGRWLVYLAAPANVDTVNGPASGNQAVWGTAFPAAVAAGGNRYVFATSPTLTFTSTDATKVYGDVANVSGNYTVSGFVNAATYGNVFTQDTAANAFTGVPSVTSAGTPAAANVGTYPITVAAGTLAATTGYLLAFNSAGQLTISPAPLTITANNASRLAAQPNPPFSATYAGFKNAETPAALGGALAFTTPATIASPPGGYAITPFGQTATNYAITYVDGVLTVTPLPVPPLPPPSPTGGVAAANNALITATQRSAEAEEEIAPRVPDGNGVDCLELERAGARRVLTRCF